MFLKMRLSLRASSVASLLILVGSSLIVVSLASDLLGLGRQAGLGTKQFAAILMGSLLLLVGVDLLTVRLSLRMLQAPGTPIWVANARIQALDGLRGIAILAVLIFHLTLLNRDHSLSTLLTPVMKMGWCGVDLFFVLSGFLITGILYDSKAGQHYFRNFYAHRVLRIFPLYYLVLFGTFVCGPLIRGLAGDVRQVDLSSQLYYWSYTSNLLYAIRQGWMVGRETRHLLVTWSLAIEEQFYLVWPLLVLCGRRITLIKLCIGMIIGAFGIRLMLSLLDASPVTVYVFTLDRMDTLAVGAVLALLLRKFPNHPGYLGWARGALVLSAAGLAGILWLQGDFSEYGSLMQLFGYSLLAILFGALLLLALNSSGRGWVESICRGSSFLRTLGKYSYGIYLFHLPIILWLADWVDAMYPKVTWLGQLALYLAAVALSVLAAWVSWNVYEKRFLGLKRFFRYEPSQMQLEE